MRELNMISLFIWTCAVVKRFSRFSEKCINYIIFFKTNVLTELCLHNIKVRTKIKQIERQNYKQIENAVF